MPLNVISKETPISTGLLNLLIGAINKLENAGNLQARVKRNTTYDSGDDRIKVVANRITVTNVKASEYSSGYKLDYGWTFSDTPVVTVTMDNAQYVVPYVYSIGTASCYIGFLRIGGNNSIPNNVPTINVNLIAIGPSAS